MKPLDMNGMEIHQGDWVVRAGNGPCDSGCLFFSHIESIVEDKKCFYVRSPGKSKPGRVPYYGGFMRGYLVVPESVIPRILQKNIDNTCENCVHYLKEKYSERCIFGVEQIYPERVGCIEWERKK